jgi:Phage integrase, N-terminal SAM-like domain
VEKSINGKHGTSRNQDEELAAMAARCDECILFRREFTRLRGDFCRALARRYSPSTVRRHHNILEVFLDYLCDETSVTNLEQITKGMVNSGFRRWYHHKVWDRISDTELRTTLKKFFYFLAQKKGIKSVRALEALR